jgi:hypothetical protein
MRLAQPALYIRNIATSKGMLKIFGLISMLLNIWYIDFIRSLFIGGFDCLRQEDIGVFTDYAE